MNTLDLSTVAAALPPSTRSVGPAVNLRVSADDGMLVPGSEGHYLTCGASALAVIHSALQAAGAPAPLSILDFGAGAGRVTRWLRAAFPEAAISACDLREQDMRFCREEFQAETWVSGTDVAALVAPGRYDLIWVGSVLTHLSAETSGRLVDKLLSWTRPGGILVMSTIGRTAKARRDRTTAAFIHDAGWAEIVRQQEETGFGYADYEGQTGYGLSLTRLSWTAGLVEALPGARLVLLTEAAWDGLHDVVAIQNMEMAEPRPSADGAATFAIENDRRSAERGSLRAAARHALALVSARLGRRRRDGP